MKVKVAVIDSGIELYHEAFKNSHVSGTRIIKRGCCLEKNEDIYDTSGHGTACASMIVSACPYVDIVSIGILDGNGKSNLAALEFALESLINSDVSIINMSLAFNILVDQKLYRILKKLSEQNVTIIASMSNEGNVSYPAAYDNVIGVRAGILEKECGFWFSKSESVQCIMDCVTPVVAVPSNKYIMIPSCNSIAAARLTGIVSKMFWEKKTNKISYETVCDWLYDKALRNEWGESELSTRFRVPEKNDWFVENNDSILNEMYQVIGQYFEKRFSDKQICDIELLTRTGPLKMEMVIPFLEYVKKTMDIKIDYLKVNRYHLLTVGTLVKYIKSL